MACFGYTVMLLYRMEEESDWQCTLEYIEIKPNKADGLSSAQKKLISSFALTNLACSQTKVNIYD